MSQFTSDWFTNALVNFDYIKKYLTEENPSMTFLKLAATKDVVPVGCWKTC